MFDKKISKLNFVYNYRNFEDKCEGNNFWNSINYYKSLVFFSDFQKNNKINLEIEELQIKNSEEKEVTKEKKTCSNLVKEVNILFYHKNSEEIDKIKIIIYYVEKGFVPEISFNIIQMPIDEIKLENVYINQNNAGFSSESYLKFGVESEINQISFINSVFPISRLFVRDFNGECLKINESKNRSETFFLGEDLLKL